MDKQIGILGGGQLGRMFLEAAHKLNMRVNILDQPNCPAAKITNSTESTLIPGSFKDPALIKQLFGKSDVITIEIEHVDAQALIELQKGNVKVAVHPDPRVVQIIQDKFLQKEFLRKWGGAVGEFCEFPVDVVTYEQAANFVNELSKSYSFPIMLKSKKLAYDGRGNYLIKDPTQIIPALKSLSPTPTISDLYLEKFIPFTKELACMVVCGKNALGQSVIDTFPVVETIQENNICKLVYAPAQIDGILSLKAQQIAITAIQSFSTHCAPLCGVFGVELFLIDQEIFINEIAPRPHNSGHYTIEACNTSQFQQHLHAITDLPLGSCAMKVPAAIMMNLIGTETGAAGLNSLVTASLKYPGVSVHLYGKSECKIGRKMGHLTIVGSSFTEVEKISMELQKLAKYEHVYGGTRQRPVVGVIMGSDSDLPIMKLACEVLEEFGVAYEVTIVSAHRTPGRMMEYARNAYKRGLKVIIAGAGGAAHLPGMVAALTPLPVIGVPVALKYLDGMDSLLSIVQMPRGVPCATVAINNSTNAALLAVKMLMAGDDTLVHKMAKYVESKEAEVMEKVEDLKFLGWKDYLTTNKY